MARNTTNPPANKQDSQLYGKLYSNQLVQGKMHDDLVLLGRVVDILGASNRTHGTMEPISYRDDRDRMWGYGIP